MIHSAQIDMRTHSGPLRVHPLMDAARVAAIAQRVIQRCVVLSAHDALDICRSVTQLTYHS